MAQISSHLGNMAMHMRRYDESDRHYRESLELFTARDDQPGIAQVLNGMGNSATDRGMYDIARTCYEQSLAIRQAVGDHWGIGSCLSNLGWLAHLQHDYTGARRRYEEGLALTRAIGDQRGTAIVLNNLGFTHYALNDDEAAGACFNEALSVATAIGITPLLLELLVGIARLRARAGRVVEAAELIGLATTHPSSNSDVHTQANLLLKELGLLPLPPTIAAALERGKGRDLAATVDALRGA
jgi:tetratricopeptide (TPR) repeat protein